MDFEYYVGKQIYAWLFYNENFVDTRDQGRENKVCYVYPRVLYKDNSHELINSDDFPNMGRIEVRIQGGENAEEVYEKFGSLVSIKINSNVYPKTESNNMFSLKYNNEFGRDNSEIWIESFSSKNLYQILDIDDDFISLQAKREINAPTNAIYTTLILLRCHDKLYGPFEYDTKSEIMTLRGIKDNQYIIGEYNSFDYNDNILVIEDQNNVEEVSMIPKAVLPSPQICKNHFDWITNETLVDKFVETLRTQNGYTKEQVRQIKELARFAIVNDSNDYFTDERILRIQGLIDIAVKEEEVVSSITQFALSNEKSKFILTEEVANNFFEQIKEKITDVKSVQDHIYELNVEALSKQEQVKELEQTIERLNQQSSNSNNLISEGTKEDINKLKEENKTLQEKIEVLNNRVALELEISELKTECEKLKIERERARDNYNQQLIDNRDLEKQFSDTLESFNNQAKQTARILDSKLLDKILRGVGEETVGEEDYHFDTSSLQPSMSHNEIIEQVGTYIREKAHRNVTNNDVANYLICIAQGFITTFAGEPGTGKTSLCTILAKSLGLARAEEDSRFADVSVERGWTSHKDFIGYYNPLTKSMVESNVDIFNAFSRLDKECGTGDSPCNHEEIAPYIILLDEANLSPIEHYWAAFLKNCDFFASQNGVISLGGNHNFKLPEHLRFLATVNFDHTTEELSPRFLDRSWVIMLEPAKIDSGMEENIQNSEKLISFASIKSAFYVNQDDEIDEAIINKWNAIQSIFRNQQCAIMPRNLKMVRNYCAVACKCMDRDTPLTKLAPLDYAFSQKILPTINGSGENYKKIISELEKECTDQNMPISAKHLKRMVHVAENSMGGFYQFFAR